MTEVSVFDAKNTLSSLLDRVERGAEEITITRRGKPVARLVAIPAAPVPPGAAQRARDVRAAVAQRGERFSVDDLLALRDEGRR